MYKRQNESYANAVMNSDEENATLTGERVLREYVADSEDRDFQRAYYDLSLIHI